MKTVNVNCYNSADVFEGLRRVDAVISRLSIVFITCLLYNTGRPC